jgi:hypothetical protein
MRVGGEGVIVIGDGIGGGELLSWGDFIILVGSHFLVRLIFLSLF